MKKCNKLYILIVLSIMFIPAAYLLVAADFFVDIFRKSYNPIKKLKENKTLVAIATYLIIGVIFSNYILISTLYGIMGFLCLYSAKISKDSMSYIKELNIMKILYIASLVVLIIGIIQYFIPGFSIPDKWVDGSEYNLKKRIYSTFFNPNVFGFFINVLLITVCVNIKKLKSMDSAVFLLGVLCLYLTFSRTAWISLLMSLLVAGFVFDKKYYKYAFMIAVFLVGLDKLSSIERFDLAKAADDSSMMYRFEIWKSCIEISKDNLFTGIGFGTLFKYIQSYSTVVKPNIEHCHNMYLQITTETGIIGLALVSFIAFNFMKTLHRELALSEDKKPWITASIILIMVIVHGVVDSVLFTPQIMMIMSIYAGIMAGKAKKYTKEISL